MRRFSAGLAILVAAIVGLVAAPAASASPALPAAGYSIHVLSSPTIFSPEHDGFISEEGEPLPDTYEVTVTNTGSEPTTGPIVISDQLPRGLTATGVHGVLDDIEESTELSCETITVSCRWTEPLKPDVRLIMIVEVTVAPGTVGPVTDSGLVSGGGAPTASANVQTAIGNAAQSADEPFGLAAVSAEAVGVNGLTDPQAGDHPYETTVSFSMNTVDAPPGSLPSWDYDVAGAGGLGARVKDTVVEAPLGFVGDPTVVERCPQYDIEPENCPPSTQIGFARMNLEKRAYEGYEVPRPYYPVYNVVPDKGYPAEFVIEIRRQGIAIPLYATVTPNSNYGVRLITPGVPEAGDPADISVTFFGTPATDASEYDQFRAADKDTAPIAFLDNPTDCSTAPQVTTVGVDSWQEPGSWLADGQPNYADPRWKVKSTTQFPSLTGCNFLQFNPSLSVTPATSRADEPAGTTVNLNMPQAPQQFPALTAPDVKNTTVTLPSGLSISPSAGDGLEGCSDEQIDMSSAKIGSCPLGSQIGTAKLTTPLLPESLEGQVYLGTPNCDPCTDADASDGNMYRIFLQIEGFGVVVKIEGKIYTNASTGQLTTTFKNLPQLPISDVELQFNGGLRAALATPQECGTYTSTADLTPWSTPITPDATPISQFTVDWDGHGGACPSTLPFAPAFKAGTSNPNAGQFTPLTVTFDREDREQDFSRLKIQTPPGLLGNLASVKLCGEPQADLGTCSEESKIGEMTVAAGPGSHPFYEKGNVYITGPYKAAPYGLSIVVPTKAGPFNLGNVVVRAQIDIDPLTTALTVTTEPLPLILDGIPLRLRTANVTINRPGFIFNPTDCALLHITATISGTQGTQAEESVPFAVAGCSGLPFGPKFTVGTAGKTSRADGASLDARLQLPSGPQSNISRVKVELPKQLPSRLTTLQKACPYNTFRANPASCPAASEIGTILAVTPILPVKLRGPVYFVSHGGEAFPNLVALLQGDGDEVELVGSTFISKAGITSSTFTNIPDVPVSYFELFLPQGPSSALAANGDLCKSKLVMPTDFTAQDGAQLKQSTQITVTGCPKAKKAKRANTAHHAQTANHPHNTNHPHSTNQKGN